MTVATRTRKRLNHKAWLTSILPYLKDGVRKMSIDEICVHLGVSKATFYKQYSSKDEFISEVLNNILATLEIKSRNLVNCRLDFGERYADFMLGTLEFARTITGKLMADVKTVYPDLFAQIQSFIRSCDDKFILFYKEGVRKGIFREYDPRFVASFNRILVTEFTQPEYLLAGNLTFQQALASLIQLNLNALFDISSEESRKIYERMNSAIKELSR